MGWREHRSRAVLIVEAESEIQTRLQEILKQAGHEIEPVFSAGELPNHLSLEDYLIIPLDSRVWQTQGDELLTQIRQVASGSAVISVAETDVIVVADLPHKKRVISFEGNEVLHFPHKPRGQETVLHEKIATSQRNCERDEFRQEEVSRTLLENSLEACPEPDERGNASGGGIPQHPAAYSQSPQCP